MQPERASQTSQNRFPQTPMSNDAQSVRQSDLTGSGKFTTPSSPRSGSQWPSLAGISHSRPLPSLPNRSQEGSMVQGDHAFQSLQPGIVLHNGRYCLQTITGRQIWAEAVETNWIARDAQRGDALVSICECWLPENRMIVVQSLLQRATIAFTSIGRHPHVPMLWDVFQGYNRVFFVFERKPGITLQERMTQLGQPLPEHEMVDCCLQMTEVLHFLSQQTPPLVHGLIRPEHIVFHETSGRYFLTHFSPVLAGGAVQCLTGTAPARLSPYTSPNFLQNPIDGRADIYALLAVTYALITGTLPRFDEKSLSRSDSNPAIALSNDLFAIVMKGLHPIGERRYQCASDLFKDLRRLRAVRLRYPQSSISLSGIQQMSPAYHSMVSLSGTTDAFLHVPAPMNRLAAQSFSQQRSQELPVLKESSPRVAPSQGTSKVPISPSRSSETVKKSAPQPVSVWSRVKARLSTSYVFGILFILLLAGVILMVTYLLLR